MIKKNKIQNKRSQGEIITTVLLILVGIAAVVIVSTFVINMVRENLKGTDCFKTTGQLKINVDEGYTWYNAGLNKVSINIERGEKDFNMTGIAVILGDGAQSKSYTIKPGAAAGITMHDGTAALSLPDPSETKTYIIDVAGAGISAINSAKIVPILYPDQRCNEGSAESNVYPPA